MQTISYYEAPQGKMLLAADESGLTGLWFEGAKYYAAGLADHCEEGVNPVLEETKRWLDAYFAGQKPDFIPPLHPTGTAFQQEVWDILRTIPYGKTTTYGQIAKELAARHGKERLSAQAVGGAVGHNKISILIPCHRVVGSDGRLTGYAGGTDKKAALLHLEGADRPNGNP